MRKLYSNLYLVNDDAITDGSGSTFLLTRKGGNILFPTKYDVRDHLDEIQDKGPVTHLLIGDRHHVGKTTVALAKQLKVPLTASVDETKVMAKKKLTVGNPLKLQAQSIVSNLTAIPTPGHTAGAFSYLYKTKSRSLLFIGDTLVPTEGDWRYWVSKANRPLMRQSLETLLKTDFDVMLCNSFAASDGAVVELTKRQKNAKLRALIKQLDV